ncbi:hypothetical protein [Aliihoeflea sp. PC F10.4]
MRQKPRIWRLGRRKSQARIDVMRLSRQMGDSCAQFIFQRLDGRKGLKRLARLEKFAQQAERQAYAAEKRQQAAETPPAEKSPVAVLKALGAAQRTSTGRSGKTCQPAIRPPGSNFRG